MRHELAAIHVRDLPVSRLTHSPCTFRVRQHRRPSACDRRIPYAWAPRRRFTESILPQHTRTCAYVSIDRSCVPRRTVSPLFAPGPRDHLISVLTTAFHPPPPPASAIRSPQPHALAAWPGGLCVNLRNPPHPAPRDYEHPAGSGSSCIVAASAPCDGLISRCKSYPVAIASSSISCLRLSTGSGPRRCNLMWHLPHPLPLRPLQPCLVALLALWRGSVWV